MSETTRDDLRGLHEQVERLQAEADALVRDLSPAQLDWHPEARRWSMADNLAHLTIMGVWYFKQIDRSIDEALARGQTPRAPARLGPVERLIVRLAEPPVRRLRVAAPGVFTPAQGRDPLSVVDGYRAHHVALLARLGRAASVDLGRARARTPLARRPRASLFGCLSLMLAHERRHLWQAREVRNHGDFPAA